MKTATIGNALGLILVALGLIMLAPVVVNPEIDSK